MSKERPGYIYFAVSACDQKVKIGFSRDPRKRIADINAGGAEPAHLLAVLPGKMSDEKWLHQLLSKWRIHGEWFRNVPPVSNLAEMACAVELPSWQTPEPAVPRGEQIKPAAPLTQSEIEDLFGPTNFQLLSELHTEFSENGTLRALALQIIRDGRVPPASPWMEYGLVASLKKGVCNASYIIGCAIKGYEAAHV